MVSFDPLNQIEWTDKQLGALATIKKFLDHPTIENLQDADAILQGLIVERSKALYATIAARKEIQDAT